MSFLIWFGVGLLVGWLVFARPAWADSLFGGAWAWIKSKIGLGAAS